RHAAFTCSAGDLVTELVALGNRFLQVLLEDLVAHGGHSGNGTFLGYRTLSLACAAHLSDWRYRSERGRRWIWANRSAARNSFGPSNAGNRKPPEPAPRWNCAT